MNHKQTQKTRYRKLKINRHKHTQISFQTTIFQNCAELLLTTELSMTIHLLLHFQMLYQLKLC